VGNALCGMPVLEPALGVTGMYLRPVRYHDLVKAWAAKPDISFHSQHDTRAFDFADDFARYEASK